MYRKDRTHREDGVAIYVGSDINFIVLKNISVVLGMFWNVFQ